jgi:ubiquinone/menaquinone biosynthesis C-methylase UbiE
MLDTVLPKSISSPAGPTSLRLVIPKIWTQKQSRAFGIYWSADANHGTLYPSPTEEELAAFYRSENYDRYLGGNALDAAPSLTILDRIIIKIAYLWDRGAESPLANILKYAPDRPAVCDLGCGDGRFLESIKASASRVVGVDPSPVSAAAIRSRGIEFYEGTAENLPSELRVGCFDVVTMFHSLEHVRSVSQSFSNARRLLKPGGLLVVEVPNMECVGFETYLEVWFHTDAGRHLQFFTRKSLENFLNAEWLTPAKYEFTGFTHQFLPDRFDTMQSQWDALFRNSDVKPLAPRPSLSNRIGHLRRSLFAPAYKKYDIVRVYARN